MTKKVLREIRAERDRQKKLHGSDEMNSLNDWVAYITAYAGRASDCIRNFREKQSSRDSLIKVAALAVAAVEAIDRGDCGE